MCLSNVYRNQIGDDNLLLSNVQRIESHGGRIVLTDILERQVTIEGELQMANCTCLASDLGCQTGR